MAGGGSVNGMTQSIIFNVFAPRNYVIAYVNAFIVKRINAVDVDDMGAVAA